MNATASMFMNGTCDHCAQLVLISRAQLLREAVLAKCHRCEKYSWFTIEQCTALSGYKVGEKHE